jgi:predicted phosphodiesterase
MRLHVLSDLHLERAPFTSPAADVDAVVLAGDIARGSRGVTWAREWAGALPVLYVAGNHEFYGHSAPGLIDELRAAAAGSRVSVLENNELVLDGVRFLGCTLWSDFDYDGPERRAESMRVCQRVVNDYEHITFDPAGRTLEPDDTRRFHIDSRRWLAERLGQSHDGPTVVITHHAPLIRRRVDGIPNPMLRAVAGAFASDVTELMGDPVSVWIFGHTHIVADVQVDGTRVVSNPRGYPNQPAADFDPGLVIEVA